MRDVANMKKICEAWQFFADQGIYLSCFAGNSKIARVTCFAECLAGSGRTVEYCKFNDASVFTSPGDKYASKCVKDNCVVAGGDGILGYAVAWDKVYDWLIVFFEEYIFSYCLIGNLPIYAPRETTPFAFTRGLCTDGTWHEKLGLYGKSGGYVIYCDGHVRWFDGKRPARFLKWDQSGYTSDIREALPSCAWIICGNDGTRTDITNDDGATMLTYHQANGGE